MIKKLWINDFWMWYNLLKVVMKWNIIIFVIEVNKVGRYRCYNVIFLKVNKIVKLKIIIIYFCYKCFFKCIIDVVWKLKYIIFKMV